MAPVALVLTTHLLMQQLSWRQQPTAFSAAQLPNADPQQDMSSSLAGTTETAGSLAGRSRPNAADTSGPEADMEARARHIYQQHRSAGRRLSGAALARKIGTSDWHGRRLLAVFRAEEPHATSRDGDSAGRGHRQGTPGDS